MINSFGLLAYLIAFGFVWAAERIVSDIAWDLSRLERLAFPAALRYPGSGIELSSVANVTSLHNVLHCGVVCKRRALDVAVSCVILFGAALGTLFLIASVCLASQFKVGKVLDGNGFSIAVLATLSIGGFVAFFAMAAFPKGVANGVSEFAISRKNDEAQPIVSDPFLEARPEMSRFLDLLLVGVVERAIAKWSRETTQERWDSVYRGAR